MAIESCRQHGELEEAQKKKEYESLLLYLYSLRGNGSDHKTVESAISSFDV